MMRYTKDGQTKTAGQIARQHRNLSFGPNTYAELGWVPEPDAPADANVPKRKQIAELEAQVTPRRVREAILGRVASITFIQSIDDQIDAIRATIV